MRAAHDSLRRLGTDRVDVYYTHLDDEATPARGDVPAPSATSSGPATSAMSGSSNYRGWRIAEVVRSLPGAGRPSPIVCQPYYNAFNRMPEVEVLPACGHFGLGVVPYSPLARGVLTGKYRARCRTPGRLARRPQRSAR